MGGHCSGGSKKKTQQFKKPTLVEFEEKLYLVAEDIFLLGLPVVKLTPEDVLALPVIVSWSGPKMEFKTDHEAGFRLLAEIIHDFNVMQNKKFTSFPLGNILKKIVRLRLSCASYLT